MYFIEIEEWVNLVEKVKDGTTHKPLFVGAFTKCYWCRFFPKYLDKAEQEFKEEFDFFLFDTEKEENVPSKYYVIPVETVPSSYMYAHSAYVHNKNRRSGKYISFPNFKSGVPESADQLLESIKYYIDFYKDLQKQNEALHYV